MDNPTIATELETLADLSEIAGENPFKVRAYRAAAQRIRDLAQNVEELVSERGYEALDALPGIGPRITEKIRQLLETGRIEKRVELERRIPPTLLDVLALDGVGPKKARTFWEKLGIANVDQLEEAARSHKLRELPRMGAKSEQRILEAIERWRRHRGRYLLPDAEREAKRVIDVIRHLSGVECVEAAGSLRRRRETIGDLDVLVAARESEPVMDAVCALAESITMRGPTRTSVRLASGMACDVRVVERDSWGAALHYFTGSKAHNVALRSRARSEGILINEYGVFRVGEHGNPEKRIGGAEEAEVFLALGLDWIPPELREQRGEIEAAAAGTLPALLEVQDVSGDLHCHTLWSDGRASIEEMARAAAAFGHRYLAITDHSARLAMTGGLDAERVAEQAEEIERVRERLGDTIRLFHGIEVDILEDGSLDLPARALERLEVVVASVHSHFNQDRETMTRRLLAAIDSGHIDILGHPSGRLLLRRDPYDFDHEQVFRRAARRGVALEINASPMRLDLADTLARLARDLGCKLVIDTDAHHPRHFDFLRYGVGTARRGWCTRADILNTERDPERFLERLHEGHR